MKVALLLTGLARKIEEGYNQYWKYVIEKYNPDLYLHAWEIEEYELVEKFYPNHKLLKIEPPVNFSKYAEGVETKRPNDLGFSEEFGVGGVLRTFPMFYSWQQTYKEIKQPYNWIIRSRYDLGNYTELKFEEWPTEYLYVTKQHWGQSFVIDDNIIIMNQGNADRLLYDVFDNYVEYVNKDKRIDFAESEFSRILIRKNLYSSVVKHPEITFDLLRNNDDWK